MSALTDFMRQCHEPQVGALQTRIAALEEQNKLWQQNMREAYEAFTAMRNDLNELFPMQSAEADLSEGPEWSVACAAIVDAARDRFAALEAQLAERVKVDDVLDAASEYMKTQYGIGALSHPTDRNRILSALEASPPAPKVTEGEWREIEQVAQPRIRDGYTAVKISRPGFWFVKGPGPAMPLTAAQEAGKP